MKKDYQIHVFTSTYTADVSGVCSALYELGGMSVLHDPSGCNSTYSTHDEPRWFDTDSLMFVSGLDEITAVMGDDDVLIRDVAQAVRDLSPRFVTLCGASIPHIIAFDYRGVAYLIEKECGVPVLPVPTDGLKSYVSGVGLALAAWLERFADPAETASTQENSVNLVGVTPLDFSVNGNVRALRAAFEDAGFSVNCCMAMGDSFETLTHAYRARVNVVVSSAGRHAVKLMKKKGGIPWVEGLPIGAAQTDAVLRAVEQTLADRQNRTAWDDFGNTGRWSVPEGGILVLGEEVFAKSLAHAVNRLPLSARSGRKAYPFWPDVDEGVPEEELIAAVRGAHTVIADPLYKVVLKKDGTTRFIELPHEAYSGRIFRASIPVFCGPDFSVENLLKEG